ncbi:hypothetical protein C8A05DRAFT_42150 [Staphylotrichum tortipilum]|uniref:Transfer RNA methyltransferase 82 n=1 Tax=Staphylotrichum tortipilum TaxID=2831512 RepID=A0AAN6MRW1_9PEZI|nr:hypothetical protein C8A05DRAFT_42150 [Staphylotrichum longicolle]
MDLPYHLIKVCGNVVFAAQGSDIHSFSSALEHISTWKYPVKQPDESKAPESEAQESPAPEGPPTKRRKVENGQESASKGQQGSKKNVKHDLPANEKPFLQKLFTTADGRHLVAMTGSDKTIWVFEHDGAGNLKQLSQRAMPKRPCSLALTLDNRTILSADKFGDVYALPLLPSTPTTEQQPPKSGSVTPIPTPSSTTPIPFKSQANELTVHTKRNLRALENQKISLRRNAQQDEAAGGTTAQCEHTLLLGHVSMLTAVCVGTVTTEGGKTREYIITADRDEHIRVSRGMPQAFIIEGFCLGHEDFVSQLCVAPGGRVEVLISGGGDDYLFVWDWVKGELLGRVGVLEHVKGVVGGGEEEEVNKVAVTRVFACGMGEKTSVFVVVERVPALFHYELLPSNTLQHRTTIPLPGNPLDVDALSDASSPTPRLLVTVDSSTLTSAEEGAAVASGPSLITLDQEGAGWRRTTAENLPAGEAVNMTTAELHKILYSTESLRKISDFD